ncbi:MAG: bifunctional homocysteine S-methyltransferase/methylenetetrahydrofolate reductase [Clostridiales bacterium]|nr:bifunctional homocysteine S-methyltransferase/methylenetetrahydrofolate reductase [Clostridiales bacterium]
MGKLEIKKNHLLFDGAFGSYYYSQSCDDAPCELANIKSPDAVLDIHSRYIEAGAQAIKTNTFSANTVSLKTDFSLVQEVIRNGYNLAKKAAGERALVFADIGPFQLDNSEATQSEYLRIVDEFLSLGAVNFLFETFPEYEVLRPVLRHIRERRDDAFIILSFAASQDGYTRQGNYYKTLLDEAENEGLADSIGLNCICGPTHILQLYRELNNPSGCFSIMPNAGYPVLSGGRILYNNNAEYFAKKLAEIAKSGVKILGGCCGTTPEHIQLAAQLLKSTQIWEDTQLPVPIKTAQTAKESEFQKKLNHGDKVFAVELAPPAGIDAETLVERAKAAKKAGADIITLPDSPLSRARADSMSCASIVKRGAGIDTIPHLACRDRNMIGLKSVLLAGKMQKIDNVLAITGDPMVHTGEAVDRGVFSLHSANLIAFIENLNKDVFNGNGYYVGAALNINAANFNAELNRAMKKEKNGAEFFMTQPVFTSQSKENLKRAHQTLKSKILAGIMPVVSYKNAVFINNEISGIGVPEDLVNELRDKEKAEAAQISIRYCTDTMKSIEDHCDGYYLITPLGRIDLICEIIQAIKKK